LPTSEREKREGKKDTNRRVRASEIFGKRKRPVGKKKRGDRINPRQAEKREKKNLLAFVAKKEKKGGKEQEKKRKPEKKGPSIIEGRPGSTKGSRHWEGRLFRP